MEKIEYYFDFLSPYSYLSWHWVKRNQHQFKFEYYPVVLGRLIHHYETKGPAEITPKRNYLFKDCLRYAHQHQIPFQIPGKLPFNSLYALRVALKEISADKQPEVIDAIFEAGWGKGRSIDNSIDLVDILNMRSLDGELLMDLAVSASARKGLKENQKRAIDQKLFGLPSFLVRNELFWGNDSTAHLERFIKGEDMYDERVWKQFFEIGNFGEEK